MPPELRLIRNDEQLRRIEAEMTFARRLKIFALLVMLGVLGGGSVVWFVMSTFFPRR